MMYDYKKDLDNLSYDDGTHTEIDERGTKIWRNDEGQYHREDDKPARIYSNGGMEWLINGKQHRENDKPAVISPGGSRAWRINGKRHRENNKPAWVDPNGYREWYINDEYIIPKLEHMIAAIEDDLLFIDHWRFICFIKEQKNIPLKDQELILKYNPRLAEYIPNLDPKFKRTKQAVGFGMF